MQTNNPEIVNNIYVGLSDPTPSQTQHPMYFTWPVSNYPPPLLRIVKAAIPASWYTTDWSDSLIYWLEGLADIITMGSYFFVTYTDHSGKNTHDTHM